MSIKPVGAGMNGQEIAALVNAFYAATGYNLFEFASIHYKRSYGESDRVLLKMLQSAEFDTSTNEMYDSHKDDTECNQPAQVEGDE